MLLGIERQGGEDGKYVAWEEGFCFFPHSFPLLCCGRCALSQPRCVPCGPCIAGATALLLLLLTTTLMPGAGAGAGADMILVWKGKGVGLLGDRPWAFAGTIHHLYTSSGVNVRPRY